MCDEMGGTCCDACQARAGGAGNAGPDKLGDTQPVTLSTAPIPLSLTGGKAKFNTPFDRSKADFVERQNNVSAYAQFG